MRLEKVRSYTPKEEPSADLCEGPGKGRGPSRRSLPFRRHSRRTCFSRKHDVLRPLQFNFSLFAICLWVPYFKTRRTYVYEISSIYSNILYYNTYISIIYEIIINIYSDRYEIQLLINTYLLLMVLVLRDPMVYF